MADQQGGGPALLGAEDIRLTPVGQIQSPIKAPSLKGSKDGIKHSAGGGNGGARQRHRENDHDSTIVIKQEFAELLDGIEDFSHAMVIYWPHLLPVEGRKARKVHPAGFEDMPLTGVFATCSPARPNPLLTTVVEVVAHEGNVLKVHGLEAVDGSPVLDIKPYNRHYMLRPEAKAAEWMEQLDEMFT